MWSEELALCPPFRKRSPPSPKAPSPEVAARSPRKELVAWRLWIIACHKLKRQRQQLIQRQATISVPIQLPKQSRRIRARSLCGQQLGKLLCADGPTVVLINQVDQIATRRQKPGDAALLRGTPRSAARSSAETLAETPFLRSLSAPETSRWNSSLDPQTDASSVCHHPPSRRSVECAAPVRGKSSDSTPSPFRSQRANSAENLRTNGAESVDCSIQSLPRPTIFSAFCRFVYRRTQHAPTPYELPHLTAHLCAAPTCMQSPSVRFLPAAPAVIMGHGSQSAARARRSACPGICASRATPAPR